jgi:nucleoside-diphosphate-sugar epimerase
MSAETISADSSLRNFEDLPDQVRDVEQLEELLSRPGRPAVDLMRRLDGDLMILGASGKIGPTLTRMALRAVQEAGTKTRVFAADCVCLKDLAAAGAQTVPCDLLDRHAAARLPKVANVIYMVGRKFGSSGQESLIWAINVLAAGRAAEALGQGKVAAFSTGCVYPLMTPDSGGATEQTPPAPVGEYAMSCLGRERMFDHFSHAAGLRVLHFRLNYAVELRYGVLVDVARKVWTGQPIDLTTGYANVLWQGDVCNQALLGLELAACPPRALNVTGPQILHIRDLARQFGRLMGREPVLAGTENNLAYLSNAAQAQELFGPPRVDTDRLIRWTADWIAGGRTTLDKPTHYETQNGTY